MVLEGQFLRPEGSPVKTVLVFAHPTGTMNTLPLPNALARAGVPVLRRGSRYPHNDTALIMEKVLIDLGAYVRYARERLSFEKVVLAGGAAVGRFALLSKPGGTPTVEATPAGDRWICGSEAASADGVMQLAAHVSRATTLTEWLDPSVLDETDPNRRPRARPRRRFRAQAALQRCLRPVPGGAEAASGLRSGVGALEALRAAGRPYDEEAFVVHGTMADPRWLTRPWSE